MPAAHTVISGAYMDVGGVRLLKKRKRRGWGIFSKGGLELEGGSLYACLFVNLFL